VKPAHWSISAASTLLLGGGFVACAALSGLDSYTTAACVVDCDATAGGTTPGDDGSSGTPMEGSEPAPDATEEAAARGDDMEGADDAAQTPDVLATVDSGGTEVEASAPAEAGMTAEAGMMAEAGPAHDAGGTADAGGGVCTATNTVENCGACGVSCNTTTGTPLCNGVSCQYECDSNRIDCNGETPPDTDGCECAGTACCGTACETAHETGIPSPTAYYTCTPTGNSSELQATGACLGVGGLGCAPQMADCPANSTLVQTFAVCGTVSGTCYCWAYAGVTSGTVGSVPIGCSAIPCTAGNAWN
jgi:hypothetical protein